ncbi:protein-arginine deiminase family protein [Vibrio ouci]|uniref:Protein-arginine deiminase n=1 Tax=Vibrio ouci TaxID=2499078 RepID=A0A4Y8WBF9_9VIBR|nr:protein-arginine deiminase family protein [Vibrio ouci]TFH89611.1 hypothetical protein ELS82_21265 [Vibrio ouci]
MESNHFISKREDVRVNFSIQIGALVLESAHGIKLFHVESNEWKEFALNTPVHAPLAFEGLIRVKPLEFGENKATLIHVDNNGQEIDKIEINVAVCCVSLRNDSDRDGDIDLIDTANDNWVWGSNQRGAVVLVNNDLETEEHDPSGRYHSEWAKLVVENTQLDEFPEGFSLILASTEAAAPRFTVYKESSTGKYERILGLDPSGEKKTLIESPPLSPKGENLYLEAHEYPSENFEGLITLELLLVKGQFVMSIDAAVFRVAPWIMTPNTLPPERVFACRIVDEGSSNEKFLEGLTKALNNINIPLTIIEPQDHLGDRWIQDEVEFGYVQAPSHILPVVMDSPRDRGLDGFPEKKLLGEDFGHFQLGGSNPGSLDSFGNLEVSPPVSVNGREYPFGRIVFGGKKYGDYSVDYRKMMPQLRNFLYSQKVQSPFEIYTDWLSVGHVDEIFSFVPSVNDIGFQVLVASPRRAKAILERLSLNGQGNAIMFEGLKRSGPKGRESAEKKVDELLNDEEFWQGNHGYQDIIDTNTSIIKRELGVGDEHVIQIPVLFHPTGANRTSAYFPNMINHLVINHVSMVPKPHGPLVDGECAFEKAFKNAVPQRDVVFIEDWYSYHLLGGEVHCGTNVQRKPFSHKTWWSLKPDGGYDI